MTVNHEVKGSLAKLLATENLIIEHKKVSTACFDVLNRVLVLPIWDKASSTVYDLLVGHEVGHALYTPNEDWSQKYDIPKDFVNVIEDARVEKLMKRKYPGLARSFYNGYKELNDDDFFGIADEDIENISLIDRINLHFKIGAYACIPFTEKEQVYVDMTEKAESFQDVIEICKLIYKEIKDKVEEPVNLPANVSKNELGQGEKIEQDNQDEESTEEEETTEETKEESEEENSVENLNNNSMTPQPKVDETVSKTQKSFDSEAEKLTDKISFEDPTYVEVPKVDIDKIIVDANDVRSYLTSQFKFIDLDKKKHYGNVFSRSDTDYRKYKKESQKEVNYLVKEFEMKKSADAYQRLAVSKTGVLDTAKLHTYKYNEDLFKKVSVIPDGKNHGLIFVVDWSGSMGNYILDTVKQLLNLVWFCKKVQIPFEVYGFTYEWSPRFLNPEYYIEFENNYRYERKHGMISIHRNFYLLNFLTSKTNSKNFEQDCLNLWRLAFKMNDCYDNQYNIPAGFDLSGTPLNESIISLHQIIPQFKSEHKLQKVNVVILTDGESNGITYDVDLSKKYPGGPNRLGNNCVNNQILRNRKTGRIYRRFGHQMPDWITTILLEDLKHSFPEVNLIGFRILTGSNASSLIRESQGLSSYNYFVEDPKSVKKAQELIANWKKDKSVELNEGIGYDALYAISSHNLSANTEFDVEQNASTKEISKAFRGMLKKKTVNKKILSSFAGLVS